MITLQEICFHLNALLVPDVFSDGCPNGLQVEGKPKIQRVATAVSASEQVIEAAVKAQVDALIVHHGMFWSGDGYPVIGSKRRKLRMLLDHGISLLAYHIPLDAHQEFGNNWKAARDMEWGDRQAFGSYKGQLIGVRGVLPHLSVTEVMERLESYYDHPAMHAPGGPEAIRSIALISGGAHWSIKEAIQHGIDAFVTGSFDEPIWHIAREEKIHFFALGHAATEKIGPKALGDYIQSELELPCQFIDEVNPF